MNRLSLLPILLLAATPGPLDAPPPAPAVPERSATLGHLHQRPPRDPEPQQVVDLADDIMYAADRRDRPLWLAARVLAAVAAMIEDERPEEEP